MAKAGDRIRGTLSARIRPLIVPQSRIHNHHAVANRSTNSSSLVNEAELNQVDKAKKMFNTLYGAPYPADLQRQADTSVCVALVTIRMEHMDLGTFSVFLASIDVMAIQLHWALAPVLKTVCFRSAFAAPPILLDASAPHQFFASWPSA
jgi:hypothetical protein